MCMHIVVPLALYSLRQQKNVFPFHLRLVGVQMWDLFPKYVSMETINFCDTVCHWSSCVVFRMHANLAKRGLCGCSLILRLARDY